VKYSIHLNLYICLYNFKLIRGIYDTKRPINGSLPSTLATSDEK
jgi:hypothetical protein